MDGLKGCDVLTDRLADPKTIVNVAESVFQILAPQPSQSVPSILSRPSFVAKPNSPCSSEVPGSCSVHHHYCESLFARIQIEGWNTQKMKPQSDNNIIFLWALLEKRSKHWEITLFYYLFILFHARECRPSVLFCWHNGESWTPEKRQDCMGD